MELHKLYELRNDLMQYNEWRALKSIVLELVELLIAEKENNV